MNKAILLDRDGIILVERGDYNHLSEHHVYVEGIEEALSKLQQEGFLLIVITNQSGIAKGVYSEERVIHMHEEIKDHFKQRNIDIIDFYFCPHHPDITQCLCRKPGSLMLERAIAKYDLDKNKTWFIGDKERDMEAGRAAGVHTLYLEENSNLMNFLEPILSK